MVRSVRLLGRPSIDVDGVPAPGPRGRKAWGLLTLLALTETAPSRQRLASLFFGGADDPMGALRWGLAELRRALGGEDVLSGDPVRFCPPPDMQIDVLSLGERAPRWLATGDVPGELLAGMDFPGCDAFEAWLIVERRRQAGAVEAILHEEALAWLAGGRPNDASRLAARLVELNPYDENHHVVLVRALAMAGDRKGAHIASEHAYAFLRRELAIEPSPALREAVAASVGGSSVPASFGVAAARAQLVAGRAAIAAGAVDAGLECLRRCVDEMRFTPDDPLFVEALCELGGALVHSVGGRDEEASSVLHEVVERAARVEPRLVARACQELGFVDVKAGRRDRARHWLALAVEHATACGDDGEVAAILGVQGSNLSDQACYPEAADVLRESIDRALQNDSPRQVAWSAAALGRLHLLRGDHDQARHELERSLQLVDRERWLAFRPWPEAFFAELDLSEGRYGAAEERLAEAFALACHLGDPCWEGITARGIGLLQTRRDPERAVATLLDAGTRCVRWPGAYQWVHGYILDALCSAALVSASPEGQGAAERLLRLASRGNMRELICRAQCHLAALGHPGSAAAAELIALDIDNPILRGEVVQAQSN